MAKQPEENQMEGKPEETTPTQILHLREDQFMAEQRPRTEGGLFGNSNASEQRTECSSFTNSLSVSAKQNKVAGSFRTSKNLVPKTEGISKNHSSTAEQRSIEGSDWSVAPTVLNKEQRPAHLKSTTALSKKQREVRTSNPITLNQDS